ncbi:hypothetical protein DSECCO2_524050 [anaerobic digester metagenome]
MIFFQPADAGINSILGQMMWFKRFCRGHKLDFDYALDLDDSKRNIASKGLHTLFFDEQLKCNLHREVAETIGLNDFFYRVLKGVFDTTRDVRVFAGTLGNVTEPGLWRLPEFQLHCLEQGFLSSRFPYWETSLEEWTCHGEIAKAGKGCALTGRTPRTCLVHLRIGDCAVLLSKDIERLLGVSVPGYAFALNRFMPQEEFELYQLGLHHEIFPRHYAERGARLVSMHAVCQAVRHVQEKYGQDIEITLISDGYSRVATQLAQMINMPQIDIEAGLNQNFDPILNECSKVLVGEYRNNLPDVVLQITQAEVLVTGPSLFAPTVKCALCGEASLQNWIVVDETDVISRYLQHPCLINHSQHIFKAMLQRQIVLEPVPKPSFASA